MLIALFLAAAAATQSDVCAKLDKEFEQNERDMAFEHYFNESFVEIWTRAGDRARAEKARAELQADDEERKLDGDRITTLILANKCRPPDHVTSWKTYKHEVEELKQRVAGKSATKAGE